MIASFEALRDVDTLAEAQAAFGEFLGLDGPVPAKVIRHAFADQYFRHNLILCRNRPELLWKLMQHPRNAEFEEQAAPASASPAAASRGAPELAAKAGKALYTWAMSGFALLEQEAFEARFAACEACDLLSEAPDTLLYRVTRSKRGDPRVCGACGCVAARKARLASESCPMPDRTDPTRTRWGEPMRANENAGQ
jgi:hypothetical protein